MNNKLVVVDEELRPPVESHGSLAVSLARAEVDQQVTTARAYPRSITRAVEHILTLATLDETAAAECIYAVSRGKDPDTGKKIILKGPSIRLAEIVAGQWGNCRVGARVVHVDRVEKYVEAEGVFHDLETNMATTARERRGIVTKYGRLYSEDMIIMTGRAACAIAKRNAILGAVPRGIWRQTYEAVERVISGDVKTLVSRRGSALATLAAEYGISAEHIFDALEIGGEEDIDLEKLSTLTAMRASLKNGEATVDELFPKSQAKEPSFGKGLNAKLDAIAVTAEECEISDDMAARAQAATAAANADAPEKDQLDRGTQRLLDDARARTRDGALKFKYWHAKLNQEQANRLAPYLDQLRERANAADAEPRN